MKELAHLLEANQQWADEMAQQDPMFFRRLKEQQSPEYLWIGCSDSRVPANQIIGLFPGEVFVHRNVANQVTETDFNVLAVVQFAVDILKVKHIIVCGHYGCGGVKAALENHRHGLIDNWLVGIRALSRENREELQALSHEQALDRLCELNVIAQAKHIARTTIVEDAWDRDQILCVHSWIYRLDNGKIHVLAPTIKNKFSVE
jgi:carbonic anhydrase